VRRAFLALVLAALLLAVVPPLLGRLGLTGPDPALLPPRARAVVIAPGLTLNVAELGSGPPVVLVHGLPSNLGDWAALPERLAALGHRVVAYDRAGYGYSSRPAAGEQGYSFDSNARDLHALLAALELKRALLVGWSYGGGVVQRFAAEAPEKTAGIVLLSSVGPLPTGSSTPLDRLVALPFAAALLEWIASVPPLGRAMTRDGVANAFSGEAAIPPGWLERTQAMLALPGTLRTLVLEMQRYNPRVLRAESLPAPVLVVHGSDDRDVPLAQGEDLHRRIPGSELVVVPGGSHMLPATHPDLLAEHIHRLATAKR
jgi:non-heme chloroperoxidase